MPRRKKQPEADEPNLDPALVDEFTAAMADNPVDALKEQIPGLTSATEHPRQLEAPTHVEQELRRRPTGPRPRKPGEPATSFASEDLRIIRDGYTWQVTANRELTGDEKDRLAASGFQAVDDDEKVWNANQRELARRGTDINVVALALGKPEIAGRGK